MTTPESASTADNPRLSAQEIGKRFLKLLEGLTSREDLSLERIEEVTGIALPYVQGGDATRTARRLKTAGTTHSGMSRNRFLCRMESALTSANQRNALAICQRFAPWISITTVAH